MAGRVAVRAVREAEQQLAVGELDLEALPLARAFGRLCSRQLEQLLYACVPINQ